MIGGGEVVGGLDDCVGLGEPALVVQVGREVLWETEAKSLDPLQGEQALAVYVDGGQAVWGVVLTLYQ